MIPPRAQGPAGRHRHVPLHGRRGLDEAARRARQRGLRRCARTAPADRARGLRGPRRRRGRHARGRLLLRVPDRSWRVPRVRGHRRRARARADPGSDRPPHRHAAPDRRGLRRPGRPSRRPHRRLRARRPGARLVLHVRAGRRGRPLATSASTASRTSRLRSASISSETATSLRSRASTGPTCRYRRPRSSVASGSWTRWSRFSDPETSGC